MRVRMNIGTRHSAEGFDTEEEHDMGIRTEIAAVIIALLVFWAAAGGEGELSPALAELRAQDRPGQNS